MALFILKGLATNDGIDRLKMASPVYEREISVAATPILFNCSTWSFIIASRAIQATMIVKTVPAS